MTSKGSQKWVLPKVAVQPSPVAIGGGMDLATAPMFAKPGTARLAYNYEWGINGGLEALGGIEPFDGQQAPSTAEYVLLDTNDGDLGVVSEGETLEGSDSGATGQVIYVNGTQVAMTKVVGTFVLDEQLLRLAVPVATVSDLTPAVDGFLDNQLYKAAADVYQADIGKVPGEGPVRGVAILDDVLYAWRNAVGGASMAIYKSSTSGWTLVDLGETVAFTAGTTLYEDGDTLTQGGVSATITRVVKETGTWGADAAGKFVITGRTGGNFAAGAAAGGGVCTLSGAQTATTLLPGGRVRWDVYGFTAELQQRIYGCDGVNPEFEFDGTSYVPLTTGMAPIRASTVRCHKKHLFFSYLGSLQHSAIGDPYSWSPIFGASELGVGDTITNLISVGGSTDAAALVVMCANSMHVLYGNSSADWNLTPQSKVAGAKADSAQDIGGVVGLDTPGIMRYPQTLAFGNFAWNSVSMDIQPIAREKDCWCSVFVAGRFKYRLFFTDGTAVSGLPSPDGKRYDWSVINYGRNIIIAETGEIAGAARVFYADDNGWVYEADKGRSFAGDAITRALVLHPLTQRSPQLEKSYREMRVEAQTQSACTIYTQGQFNDDEEPSQQIASEQYGQGLQWDLANWDQSTWDVATTKRWMVPLEGDGTEVTISFYSEADNELPHTLYAVVPIYTGRKLRR